MDPVVSGDVMQEWMANSCRDWISLTGIKNEMEIPAINPNKNENYLGEFMSWLHMTYAAKRGLLVLSARQANLHPE